MRFFLLFSGPAGASDHFLQQSDLLNMWSSSNIHSAHFSYESLCSWCNPSNNRLKLYVSVSVWVRLGREGACRGPRWVPPSPDVWMAFVMRSFCSCVFSLLLCVLYPTHNELSISLWHPTGERRKCLTDPAGTSSYSTLSENTWCVICFHVFDVKLHGDFFSPINYYVIFSCSLKCC